MNFMGIINRKEVFKKNLQSGKVYFNARNCFEIGALTILRIDNDNQTEVFPSLVPAYIFLFSCTFSFNLFFHKIKNIGFIKHHGDAFIFMFCIYMNNLTH